MAGWSASAHRSHARLPAAVFGITFVCPAARPISATSLMYLTDAANWILVAAVSLRFFSNPTPARRRFYRILSLYLWVNAVVVLILGYLELKLGWRDGLQDAAWGLPELALCASFALQPGSLRTDNERRAAAESWSRWDC